MRGKKIAGRMDLCIALGHCNFIRARKSKGMRKAVIYSSFP
jgi:hypothetical protein